MVDDRLEVVTLYVHLQTRDLLAQQWKYSPMDTLQAGGSLVEQATT